MSRKLSVGAWIWAVLLLGAWPGPAFAQINTGTVLGTVKDAQGGVIPGATVTLISEARGTRSAPVVTNESGDFVFANVSADTYTIEVALESFKTSQRSGIAVSPGARIAVGTLALEVGGASETVVVKGETPQVQSTQRRALVQRHDRRGHEPADCDPQLRRPHQPDPGRRQRQPRRRLAVDRRRLQQLHDGRRVDDGAGQQPADDCRERRVDLRGQGAHLELPGRVRTVERAAGDRRDQERHQPVSWLGLRRRAQLGLVFQQPDQHPQRRSEDDVEGAGLGLLDRRPDRKAGRPQQAVLLLRPGVSAAHHRQQRRTLPRADRARAAGRLFADDRQQRQSLPVHQGPAALRHLLGRQSGGVLCGRRCRRQNSRESSLPDRAEHPQPVSAAEHHQRAGWAELQLRADAAGAEPDVLAARRAHRLSAVHGTARHVQVRRLGSAERRDSRIPSRIQRHPDERSGRAALVGDLELHPQLDHVRRGDVRARLAPAGGLRAERQRRQLLHRRVSGQPDRQPAHERAERSAEPVPRRQRRRSGLLPIRSPDRGESDELRRHPRPPAADPSSGAGGSRTRRRTPSIPASPTTPRSGISLSASPRSGAGIPSRPASTSSQPTSGRTRATRSARSTSATMPTTRSTPGSGLPMPRSASSAPTIRRHGSSRVSISTPTTRPTSRTTGRSPTG